MWLVVISICSLEHIEMWPAVTSVCSLEHIEMWPVVTNVCSLEHIEMRPVVTNVCSLERIEMRPVVTNVCSLEHIEMWPLVTSVCAECSVTLSTLRYTVKVYLLLCTSWRCRGAWRCNTPPSLALDERTWPALRHGCVFYFFGLRCKTLN